MLDQRLQADQADPAEQHVEAYRQAFKTADGKRLQQYARDGDTPNNAEQCPAPGALQAEQRHRGIGAGNKKEDRAVIHYAQNGFEGRVSDPMVEARDRDHQEHRAAVDRIACNRKGTGVTAADDHQHRQSRDACGD